MIRDVVTSEGFSLEALRADLQQGAARRLEGFEASLQTRVQQPREANLAALRETGVIFAALIGTLKLGEPFGTRRVVAGSDGVRSGAVRHGADPRNDWPAIGRTGDAIHAGRPRP